MERCEFNPETGGPSSTTGPCHNEAQWRTADGAWHICDQCKSHPYFKRRRKWISLKRDRSTRVDTMANRALGTLIDRMVEHKRSEPEDDMDFCDELPTPESVENELMNVFAKIMLQ